MSQVEAFLSGYTGNTAAAYRRDLADWAIWFDADLLTATRADVNGYTRYMESQGKSAATIARRLSALKGLYSYAIEEGDLALNPLAHVRRPKVSQDSPTLGLNRAEAIAFLAAAKADSLKAHALVSLLLHTAIRVSEALALDSDDLVIDSGTHCARIAGKGGKVRLVPLTGCQEAVQDYLAGRTGPVFLSRSGDRWTRGAAFHVVRRIAGAAGIEQADRITPHSLKHTAVSLALESGAPLHEVQDFAGHSDPRVTMRYNRQRHTLSNSPAHALSKLFTA